MAIKLRVAATATLLALLVAVIPASPAHAARSWATVNQARSWAGVNPAVGAVRRIGASCTWVRHRHWKQHPCVTVLASRDRLGQWVVRGQASTAGYRGRGSRVRQAMPVAISVRLGRSTGHTPTGRATRRYARTGRLVVDGPVPAASAAYWVDFPDGHRALYRWRSNP